MKAVTIAKTIFFILSALLCIGFFVLFSKIADKQRQRKLKNKPIVQAELPLYSQISLEPQESVSSVFSCGDFLCVQIHKNSVFSKLLILDIDTAQTIRILSTQN